MLVDITFVPFDERDEQPGMEVWIVYLATLSISIYEFLRATDRLAFFCLSPVQAFLSSFSLPLSSNF